LITSRLRALPPYSISGDGRCSVDPTRTGDEEKACRRHHWQKVIGVNATMAKKYLFSRGNSCFSKTTLVNIIVY
jgi:hypothetical protein